MYSLKQTRKDIINDLLSQKKSFFDFIKAYLYSARFRILLNHRFGKFLFKSNVFILRQISLYYKYRLITKRNCDISYKCFIGTGLKLPHPIGIVIGEGVTINNNVMIFQQVTLGSHGKPGKKMEYPIVEDNVKIFAGAKIIGGVTIGKNSIVGANSIVNKDVPANSIVYGIPCKIKNNLI